MTQIGMREQRGKRAQNMDLHNSEKRLCCKVQTSLTLTALTPEEIIHQHETKSVAKRQKIVAQSLPQIPIIPPALSKELNAQANLDSLKKDALAMKNKLNAIDDPLIKIIGLKIIETLKKEIDLCAIELDKILNRSVNEEIKFHPEKMMLKIKVAQKEVRFCYSKHHSNRLKPTLNSDVEIMNCLSLDTCISFLRDREITTSLLQHLSYKAFNSFIFGNHYNRIKSRNLLHFLDDQSKQGPKNFNAEEIIQLILFKYPGFFKYLPPKFKEDKNFQLNLILKSPSLDFQDHFQFNDLMQNSENVISILKQHPRFFSCDTLHSYLYDFTIEQLFKVIEVACKTLSLGDFKEALVPSSYTDTEKALISFFLYLFTDVSKTRSKKHLTLGPTFELYASPLFLDKKNSVKLSGIKGKKIPDFKSMSLNQVKNCLALENESIKMSDTLATSLVEKPIMLWNDGLLIKLYQQIPVTYFTEIINACTELIKTDCNTGHLGYQLSEFLENLDMTKVTHKTDLLNLFASISFDRPFTLRTLLNHIFGDIKAITQNEWMIIIDKIKINFCKNLQELYLLTNDPLVLQKIATACIETIWQDRSFLVDLLTFSYQESELSTKYERIFIINALLSNSREFVVTDEDKLYISLTLGRRYTLKQTYLRITKFVKSCNEDVKTAHILPTFNCLISEGKLDRAKLRLTWAKISKDDTAFNQSSKFKITNLNNDIKELIGSTLNMGPNQRGSHNFSSFLCEQIDQNKETGDQAKISIFNKIIREYSDYLFIGKTKLAESKRDSLKNKKILKDGHYFKTLLEKLAIAVENTTKVKNELIKVKASETEVATVQKEVEAAQTRLDNTFEFFRICTLNLYKSKAKLKETFIRDFFSFIAQGKLTAPIYKDLSKAETLSVMRKKEFQLLCSPQIQPAFQAFINSNGKLTSKMEILKHHLNLMGVEEYEIKGFKAACTTIHNSHVWSCNHRVD